MRKAAEEMRSEMAHCLKLIATEGGQRDNPFVTRMLDSASIERLIVIADQLGRKFEVRLIAADAQPIGDYHATRTRQHE